MTESTGKLLGLDYGRKVLVYVVIRQFIGATDNH